MNPLSLGEGQGVRSSEHVWLRAPQLIPLS